MNAANPVAGGASRAVAGDEFFRRFPATHPFLLAELTEAAGARAGVPDRRRRAPRAVPHPGAALEAQALLGAPARESARRLKDTKANKGEPPDGDDGDRREIEGLGSRRRRDLDLDPERVRARGAALRARGRVHAVRAAARARRR